MLKEELEAKIREFERQAERAIRDKARDSAVVLLSKAAFALVDLFLFERFGIVPSDHKKRKEAVSYRFPEVLPYLNDVYDRYMAAYTQRMTQTDLEVVLRAYSEIKRKIEEKAQ